MTTGSTFDVRVIQFGMRLVLEGAVSLRAASRICSMLDFHGGDCGLDAPSQTTVANHIQRVGLYLLQRRDQQRLDWIWLIDHTIAAGSLKCLVVLGISLESFRRLGRPLAHTDMTVIGLLPVESSNGQVVHAQLQSLEQQFGTPLATLSDRGSDLKKGIEMFQQEHPQVIALYDIVHLVSRVIKSILEADPRWESHRQACYRCANYLRQSPLAHLKPPKPKTKARSMNLDAEVRWSVRAIYLLDRVRCGDLNERQRQRLPAALVESRLGWLDDYRDAAAMWQEVIHTGQMIAQTVRHLGYGKQTAENIRGLLPLLQHGQSQRLVREVSQQVESMCAPIPAGTELPGSTEVLESLIGKGKRLLAHSGNSLTAHLLSLSAATTELTAELISKALATCRMKNLAQWTKRHLPTGVHTARREDIRPTPEEIKLRNRDTATTPKF